MSRPTYTVREEVGADVAEEERAGV